MPALFAPPVGVVSATQNGMTPLTRCKDTTLEVKISMLRAEGGAIVDKIVTAKN
jgi:hypothetical protein